jgi:hypothetical protein
MGDTHRRVVVHEDEEIEYKKRAKKRQQKNLPAAEAWETTTDEL